MSKKDDIFNNRYSYANGNKKHKKSKIVVDKNGVENLPKGKTKWSKKKKTIVVSSIAIATVLVIVLGIWWYVFGGMTRVNIDKSNSNLGIDDNYKYLNSGVTNIALFGIDASSNDTSRSDTIMIVSVNGKKGTVKISSILRDSYVPIDLPTGHTIHEKITHAYHYGCVYKNKGYDTSGPILAIKTLNQNFDLDIRDYVSVNFEEAAEVIDYLGGIDIVITEAERRNMNAMDYNKLIKNDNAVEQTGLVHLNGMQACQYSRIRQIDSDNERTNRQGKVLEILLEKVKEMSVTQYPGFIKTVLGIVETSLDYKTILGFTSLLKPDLQLQRITFPQTTNPDKPYYMKEGSEVIGGIYDGLWVWRYDLDAVSAYIQNFIYETDIDVDPIDYSNAATYDVDVDDDDDDNDYSYSSSSTESLEQTSSESVSSEVTSSNVSSVSSETISSSPISSQETSSQSVSSETEDQPSEYTSSESVSSQAVSSETVSSEAEPISSQAESSEPEVSSQPVSSQAESSEPEVVESDVVLG